MKYPSICQIMDLQQAVDTIETHENPVGPIHLSGDTTVWILPETSGQIVLTMAGDKALAVTVHNNENNCSDKVLQFQKAA